MTKELTTDQRTTLIGQIVAGLLAPSYRNSFLNSPFCAKFLSIK
jgi:hypothetical protein